MDKETKLISVRVNRKEWQELDNNINCSRSQFIRDAIKKQNEQDTDIKEARKKLLRLENEKKLIECEIKDTKELIYNLDKLQQENENNTIFLMDKLDIIRTVAENENGITEKRIITIANNEIKPIVLINEAKKNGIKIINENEKQKRTDKNGKAINIKPVEKETKTRNSFTTLTKMFNRSFRSEKEKYNNNISRFLKANETRFRTMCEKQKINYNDFKEHILKAYD